VKKILIFILSLMVFFVWSNAINTSCYLDEEVVEIEVFNSYDKIHSGMDLKIAIRVEILGTWHINSNVPTEDYFEATNLSIPSESFFSFAEIKYPEALSLFLEFSESPVSVFEGEIFIGGVISIPEDISLGKHKIPLLFIYQACDDRTCLPPETLEKEIIITVVDKETSIQEINTEIFTKLEKAF